VIGYTYRIRTLNRSANKKNIGVRLGRHCIDQNISVSELMGLLGVSKQTIYNWFIGVHTPGPQQATKIKELFAL
jgi:transcriptional regulator with XRE-family HTH domain